MDQLQDHFVMYYTGIGFLSRHMKLCSDTTRAIVYCHR